MVDQKLIDYIKNQLQFGRNEDVIKVLLKNVGWQNNDIEEGFNAIKTEIKIKGATAPIFNNNERQIQGFQQPTVHDNFKSSLQISKSSKKRFLTNISIIVFILSACGAALYFFYWNSPNIIFGRMIFQLAKIKSLEYSVEFNIEMNNESFINGILSQSSSSIDMLGGIDLSTMLAQRYSKEDKVIFSLGVKGASDFNDFKKQKHGAIISAVCETCAREKKISGEIKMIDNVLYAKLNELPRWGAINFNFLTADWIRVDMASGTKPLFEGIFGNNQNEIEDKNSIKESSSTQKSELSERQMKELRKIYKEHPFFRTVKMPTAEIDGIKSYYLKVELIKENFKEFLLSAKPAIEGKPFTNEEISNLDKSLENLTSLTGEIWIGKKDLLPHKALFLMSIKENGSQNSTHIFSINMFFKNFNNAVAINHPSDSRDIWEFITNDLFMGLAKIPNISFLFENYDIDNDGIANIDETNIYQTDPSSNDSDKDGINDGEDIYEELKNNILNSAGKIKIYKNNIAKYSINSLKAFYEAKARVLYNPELYLPKEAVASLATAFQHRQAGNFEKSLEELNKISMQAVSAGAVYHGLGLTYFRMNDLNKALEFFEKAFNDITYKTNSPFLYQDLFSTNYRLGFKEKSSQYLNEGIINFLDYYPLYYSLAEYYIENNNLSAAEEITKQGLIAEPLYSEFWNYLGILSDRKKENNKAFEYYKKAISLDWENATPHMNLSLSFYDLKKSKEALAEALIADMFNSSDAHIKNVLGLAYEINNSQEAAIREYKKAIQLDPFYERPYNNLGIVYENLKQYALAEQYFKKAVEVNPNYAKAYSNLGSFYFNQGIRSLFINNEHLKAKPYLEKSIEIDSNQYLSYQTLGRVYQVMSEHDNVYHNLAEVNFKKSIELKYDEFLSHRQLGFVYFVQGGREKEAIKEFEIAISLGMKDKEVEQIIKNYKQ
ncbi:MAG: tetratricopeptide repeat protein [Patescibacteria group bacterium]